MLLSREHDTGVRFTNGRRLTFAVTAEDIAIGQQLDPEGCAIARAINRTLPNGCCSWVSTQVVKIYRNGVLHEIEEARTPASMQAFMCAFDQDQTVQPTSFTVHFNAP